MRKPNYDEAVAIVRDICWVGFYDKEAKLHCNPYLLIDEKDVVLFDPGSIPDFPVIMRKIIDVVNPAEISYIIAQHQDPDVCGNIAVVEDVIERENLMIVAHRNTVRLIRHLGPRSGFYRVDENEFKLTLSSGRVLEFMFTPYLHSPGAIVSYDTKTKSLFSSDIFGAISTNWDLFEKKDFLEPMGPWHQAYMPSNAILKACLECMEQRWEIERILPQHGSVIEGDDVPRAFDYLKQLPCGIDLS